MRLLLVALIIPLLGGCGSKRPTWAKADQDLLDDLAPETPKAAALNAPKNNVGAPISAGQLTAQQASTRRCVGFVPSGEVALFIDEKRTSGAGGEQVKLSATVAQVEGAQSPLSAMELAVFDPTQNEDALLGDGLEQMVAQKLPELNAQIAAAGLLGCQGAIDSDEGGGFKRKVKHLLAFPNGHATRIAIRDNAVYVSPEGQSSRSVFPVPEGSNLKLAEAYYLSTQPHLAIVLLDASRDGIRAEVVMVKNAASQ